MHKRDERLRLLSVDHHHALVLARTARRAADGESDRSIEEVWSEVLRKFHGDISDHFAIEEDLLLPALTAAGHVELADRTLAEHAGLRGLVAESDDLQRRLGAIGDALRDHVRFEESDLFLRAQELLSDEVLLAVHEACEARDTP